MCCRRIFLLGSAVSNEYNCRKKRTCWLRLTRNSLSGKLDALAWRHVVFSKGAQGVSEMVIGRRENRWPRCPITSVSDDKRFLVIWPYDTTLHQGEKNMIKQKKNRDFNRFGREVKNSLIISGVGVSAGGTRRLFVYREHDVLLNFTNVKPSYLV